MATLCSNGTCKRIDYVFYNRSKLSCTDCQVVMGKIPGQTFSYSDHMGVSTTFVLQPENERPAMRPAKLSKSTAKSALEHIERSVKATRADTTQKLIIWTVLTLLWCGVIVVAVLDLIPSVVVAVLASILSACATVVFWYLVIFSRTESSKFSEALQEMQVLARFAE